MLLISEIYRSICGESLFSGRPCTLVRLTGCHVRCGWCDSAHAFNGGEPLLQPAVVSLLQALLADDREVLLETSGTIGPRTLVPLAAVPAGVHRIVDLKAPGSGLEPGVIDWAGIACLGAGDELKAVLADRRDYEWARDLVREAGRLPAGVPVSFSPVQDGLPAADLAQWILEDGLEVRFQLQLHKTIWPGVERGV